MVASRIAEIRQRKGLTQADVASHLKLTRQTYSAYETSKRQMSFETLCMLADFYEVSADYLLGRQEVMPSYLDEDERNVIAQYRLLSEHAKDTVKNTLFFEVSRTSKEIKKSAM